jgi:hypothetical protein
MEIGAFWAAYKIQIILWLVVVLGAFFLLKTMLGLVKLAIFLGIGAGLGWGISYGLKAAGVPGTYAYYTAAAITVIVLLFGMRRRKK